MKEVLRRIMRRIGEHTPDKRHEYNVPLLSPEEAVEIAALPYSDNLDILALGNAARAAFAPDFFNCGIINAKSGRCAEDCAFCAQSSHHQTSAPVYPLVSESVLLRKAEEAAEAGATRFGIVTSGTSLPEKEALPICRAAERIISQTGLAVCGSLGILTRQMAREFADAGISRYHHNLETAASYFPSICGTHAYEDDIESLKAAKESGLAICAGGIIGLGESWEQRVELAFTLVELNVDSIPINFLNAIPGTRLERMPRLEAREALRAIAVFRLIHPARDILIAGGRTHVLGEWQSWLYAAGANGLMIGNYLTTPGAKSDHDQAMMRALGIKP